MHNNVLTFLEDVRRRMSKLRKERKDLGKNPMFDRDVQVLDGFHVGFMNSKLFAGLCQKHGLDASASEAILMQTEIPTEPHVHAVGRSVFLPLGMDEGFANCAGGTYMGPYRASERRFELAFEPAVPGAPFVIDPGVIHMFAPAEGSRFSAIAFVSPRIQRDDGSFDISRFDGSSIHRDATMATIEVS